MSDIFTVVVDLSRVKKDKKENQLYLAMADTTKMKMIYEFKLYIQFLFSLDCSVELFHEDVRLPDLEDIRVLSRLDVVQVRPLENVEKKKYEGVKMIPKSKECNEKHGDGDPRPVPGDSVAVHNYIDSKENVCNFKSLEVHKIVQDVSGFGADERAEIPCSPSFPDSDKKCSAVQKPKDNLMKEVGNMKENKTFKLGKKTGMAENLKIGTLLQDKYYGWCGKSDSNIVTGKSLFQKNNGTPDLKSGEKSCLLKSSGKFTDVDSGAENKPCISNDLMLGDVNISKNTFKGNIWSPVKMKETNHELCDRGPPPSEIRSKSCSRSKPDSHSGPCGFHLIPGTVQKPLTSLKANPPEKKSCAEGNFGRKPLSMEEALKILTEAAAARSKTLSGNNPASHKDGKKNQFKGVCKTFKATPDGGNRNLQKSNLKHQTKSENPGTLEKGGMARVKPDSQNAKGVKSQSQSQFHVPKQETKKSTVNKKAGCGDKKQGDNALLKGCEKLDVNRSQKTGSTGKLEAETAAPNPPLQCNPAQKKKKRNKKKTSCENKTVSQSLLKDCEHLDNNHRHDKIAGAGKTESEIAHSDPLVKYGNVENIVPGDDFGDFSTSESAFLEECLHSPGLNEILKGKDFNGGESARFEKSPSRKPNFPKGDSEPGARLQCRSPDNPTGVDTSLKDRSDFRFPGNDARPNSRRDLETTDRVLENTEDGDGANVSNSSANSFRNLHISDGAVRQDVATSPFLAPKQGNTIFFTSSKEDNKDKSESHSGSPVTNRAITHLHQITDNASVDDTKDVNVSDSGGGGGLVSPQEQADLKWHHSRDGFGTEYAGTLLGIGTGSIRVGGADSDSSGSCCVPANKVMTLPHQSVPIVKTEESQYLHGLKGFGRDTKVEQLTSLHAGSSGESANLRTGNDSGSDITSNRKKKDLPFLKECVIALVMIITALAF